MFARFTTDDGEQVALNPRYIAIVKPAAKPRHVVLSCTAGYAYGTSWTVRGTYDAIVAQLEQASVTMTDRVLGS